jgi:MtN3 and saliva related transmembrane protein
MESIDVLGYVAASLTTVAFVPQVIKTWKSKSAKDISLIMFLLFNIGIILWLIYGIVIESMPIILANIVTGILALTILGFKVHDLLKDHSDN